MPRYYDSSSDSDSDSDSYSSSANSENNGEDSLRAFEELVLNHTPSLGAVNMTRAATADAANLWRGVVRLSQLSQQSQGADAAAVAAWLAQPFAAAPPALARLGFLADFEGVGAGAIRASTLARAAFGAAAGVLLALGFGAFVKPLAVHFAALGAALRAYSGPLKASVGEALSPVLDKVESALWLLSRLARVLPAAPLTKQQRSKKLHLHQDELICLEDLGLTRPGTLAGAHGMLPDIHKTIKNLIVDAVCVCADIPAPIFHRVLRELCRVEDEEFAKQKLREEQEAIVKKRQESDEAAKKQLFLETRFNYNIRPSPSNRVFEVQLHPSDPRNKPPPPAIAEAVENAAFVEQLHSTAASSNSKPVNSNQSKQPMASIKASSKKKSSKIFIKEAPSTPAPSDTASSTIERQEGDNEQVSKSETTPPPPSRITDPHDQNIILSLHTTILDGIWEVCLSDRAQAALKLISRKNEAILKPVFANLKAIADGFWVKSVCKPLVYDKLSVPVYEAKVLNNLRIVWQVDVAWLESRQSHSQVIKIWSIGNHKDVESVLPSIAAAQKTYSEGHRKRSDLRSERKGAAELLGPLVFNDDGGDAAYIAGGGNISTISGAKLDEVDALLMHDMAVTSKFIPLSKIFLNHLMAQQDEAGEFPFMLSESEDAIVRHPGSVLLCGRSGTGKTSCSIFRLLSMFYVYHCRAMDPLYSRALNSNSPCGGEKSGGNTRNENGSSGGGDVNNHIHQIFLTASPDFCVRVRSYFKRLLTALTREGGAGNSGNSSLLAVDSSNVSSRAQAFLKTVEAFKQNEKQLLAASGSAGLDIDLTAQDKGDGGGSLAEEEEGLLFEEGMEAALLGSVPDSLLDLEERHFPLFITYRKFASMMRVALGFETALSAAAAMSMDDAEEPFEVDFPVFLYKYWRHMDAKLTHKMDPSLVYNEIMGVIKGSLIAAKSSKGCLSKEEYCGLSDRSFGTFRGQREKLYELFLEYEKCKNGELDAIDKINEVNRALAKDTYSGPPIHEIFVDEVQDLTMAQLLPLVTICASPGSGLMFAGDTAQTISRGSSFRFQDLSSMIHSTLEDRGGSEFAVKNRPSQFQLTRNYRSHDGILRLAASVLDLIQIYFPNAIDSLARDMGAVDGPLPVCFLGRDEDLLAMFGIGTGGVSSGASSGGGGTETLQIPKNAVQIEFGSEQVILVRNMEDYEKLHSKLGDNALILTVEQSKGMEFEDVLIYSPFGSSPAGNGWRVFLGEIKGNQEAFPTFSTDKHNILSVELKILYTAITRARKRLWIFDSDEEARGPIYSLWKSKELVTTISSTGDFSFTSIAQKSSPEAWRKSGKSFFERRQYEPALLCFRQEHRSKPSPQSLELCLLAEANMRRVKAMRYLMEEKFTDSKKEFKSSADLYIKVGGKERILAAARCYERGEFFQSAAEIFYKNNHYADAARCYVSCKNYQLAGGSLEALAFHGSSFSTSEQSSILCQALEHYRSGSHYNDVINLIQTHSALIPAALTKRMVARASKYYDTQGNVKRKVAALSCLELDESATILKLENNFEALADLFALNGEHVLAAETCENEVHDLKKAELFYLKDGDSDSTAKGLQCFINRIWDLLFASNENWFLGNDLNVEECAEVEVQIDQWLKRIHEPEFCAGFHQDYINRMVSNLQILMCAIENEAFAISRKRLDNVLNATIVTDGVISLRRYLVVVSRVGNLLRLMDQRDVAAKLELRRIQMCAVMNLKDQVVLFFNSSSSSPMIAQLEEMFRVQVDPYVPSLRLVQKFMVEESSAISLVGRTKDKLIKCTIDEAHSCIKASMISMLISFAAVLDAALQTELIGNDVCRLKLLTGACSKNACPDYHLDSSKQYDEILKSTTVQMADLTLVCREYVKWANLLNDPTRELDVRKRRWLENSISVMSTWYKITPQRICADELKLNISKGLNSLVWKIWKDHVVDVGHNTNTIALLRCATTFELLFANTSDLASQLIRLFTSWRVGSAFGQPIVTLFTSPNIFEVVTTGLDILTHVINNVLARPQNIQRSGKACVLSILGNLTTFVLLMQHKEVILPYSWALYASKRFPFLDPSTSPAMPAINHTRLIDLVQKLLSLKDQYIQLPLAFLSTLLSQNNPNVWNPLTTFPTNATSSSLAFANFPMYINSKDPFTALKKITDQCSHDDLTFISGLRPAMRTSILWTAAAKKVACRFFDFAAVRNIAEGENDGPFKALMAGVIIGAANLNPDAPEFIPTWTEEKAQSNHGIGHVSVKTTADTMEVKNTPVVQVPLREGSAAIRIQRWYRKFRGKVSSTVALLQKWFRQVSKKRRTATYEDSVFFEVLAGVQSWPKTMKFKISVTEHRYYRAWYLLYAPETICRLTTALEKIAPLCRMKHNLDHDDDDVFDKHQEYTSLQTKAQRALSKLKVGSKQHIQFQLSSLKDTLMLASKLGEEITGVVWRHHRTPNLSNDTAIVPAHGKQHKVVSAVVHDEEEQQELQTLQAMHKAGGKKKKKLRGW